MKLVMTTFKRRGGGNAIAATPRSLGRWSDERSSEGKDRGGTGKTLRIHVR
jgi:hypothetical protein